jgi:choline dehydrogenase-like flavoprotein
MPGESPFFILKRATATTKRTSAKTPPIPPKSCSTIAAGTSLVKTDEVNPPGYSIHEVGTCRMGDDPKKSVLNKWNQSHDVKNLLVVDGASFVTAGWQNPTMTILASFHARLRTSGLKK